MSSRRPEHSAPPEFFYNSTEARKYTSNSRIIGIQVDMSSRALELLALPEDEPLLLLDVGCGSGLSGETISEGGHHWVGVDISEDMLEVAVEREVEGGLVLGDLGEGLPFRPGVFDAAISISTLQWLCNADKKSHNPAKRLYTFFSALYGCLRRGGKAVFQLYPENSSQLELITSQSLRAGFQGGVVIDYPNSSKAKKIFLVLTNGPVFVSLPPALGTADCVALSAGRQRDSRRAGKGSKSWVLSKKERWRRQGKTVRDDCKYTARKRPSKW